MRLLFVLCAIVLCKAATAQQYPLDNKRDYQWCFGYDADPPYWGRTVVDFNTSPPDTSYYPVDYDIDNENASMCDTAGNLIFYSNGNDIYGSNHQIIENGDSINCCGTAFTMLYGYGYSEVQGMIILPAPGFNDKYYLVYKPMEFLPPTNDILNYQMRYTLVAKNASANTYKVTHKEQIFDNGAFAYGALTACRHANGRDWWIVQRNYEANVYRVYLLDPSGIAFDHIQTIGTIPKPHFGQTVFSPDGSKYVMSGVYNTATADTFYINLFDFDRCSGMLSNPYRYDIPDSTSASLGGAISSNSRYLYLSAPRKVWQFDLEASDFLASQVEVAYYDGFTDSSGSGLLFKPTRFQWMQLAPDGKIYVTAGNTTYLHTIDDPDSAGIACNVSQHSFRLSSLNAYSIPNFPNYRLGPIDGSACDTLGIDVIASTNTTQTQLPAFTLYPNPTNGLLHFQSSETPTSIAVYDVCGKTISLPSTNPVDIGFLSPGVYVFELVTPQRSYRQRFVKM